MPTKKNETKKPKTKKQKSVTVTMRKRKDGSTVIKATAKGGADLRDVFPDLLR